MLCYGPSHAVFLCVAPCVMFLTPDQQPRSSSENKHVLIIEDASGSAKPDIKRQAVTELVNAYTKEGFESTAASSADVDTWILQHQPALFKATLPFKATAFAQRQMIGGVGIVRVDDPAKELTRKELAALRGCDGPLKHPVEITVTGINLDACVSGEAGVSLTEANELNLWRVPYMSKSYLPMSLLRQKLSQGRSEPMPEFDPFQLPSEASGRLIRRLFGIKIRGRTISDVPIHSIGMRDGLKVGDEILEINGCEASKRSLIEIIAYSSPDAMHFKLKRASRTVETIVRPIGVSAARLLPFRCLGTNLVDIAAEPGKRHERARWLKSLGEDRSIVILTCWHSYPGPWMPGVDLLIRRLQEQGVKWLVVSCDADGDAWENAVTNNLTCGTHVRDASLAESLSVRRTPCHFVLDREGVIVFRDVTNFELPVVVMGLLEATRSVPGAGARAHE